VRKDAIAHINDSLKQLTDFQSATVSAACRRLIGPDGPQGRLLVSDEVGLGKTLVARGVIAKLLLNHLGSGCVTRPFRVVYICSNLALVQENANKLAVFRGNESDRWVSSPSFGRLTELGLKQAAARSGILLELCSLTPATSFSLTQGGGNARERFIIWRAVAESAYVRDTAELENFFRKGVNHSWIVAGNFFYSSGGLEPETLREFSEKLGAPAQLDASMQAFAKSLGLRLQSWRSLLQGIAKLAHNQDKNRAHLEWQVRGRIREIFAEVCAKNLKADLFILDEFQRFRDLINISSQPLGNEKVSDQQVIARRVLHEGTKYATLLLSATPFKALTHIGEDEEGGAHAQQLSELVRYLCGADPAKVRRYETKRAALLTDILSLPESPLDKDSLKGDAKLAVESVLRHYICRTERAGVEPDIERVFENVVSTHSVPSVQEVEEFIALDRLSDALREASVGSAGIDVMKLHKAAPWCLSFLGGYQLRESLRSHKENSGVAAALKRSSDAWIPVEKFRGYQINLTRDAPSARFKHLLEVAAPEGAERLLWVPPSMPNYQGAGPFAEQKNFSKTLLFSSLVLAPRALSSYVSYECERRLLPTRGKRPSYFESRDVYTRTFRFDAKSLSTAWGIVYPSARLSSIQLRSYSTDLSELRRRVDEELTADYKLLRSTFGAGLVTKKTSWFVLAPMLLDWLTDEGKSHVRQWGAAMEQHSTASEMRKSQVERVLALLEGKKIELGEPPADLKRYLVDLAIAGAGNCMSRTIRAAWGRDSAAERILAGATDAAFSFLDKMNRIESQRVLRAVCGTEKPWVSVAKYSAMGNLQAVFDEYFHLLKSIHRTVHDSVSAFKVAVDTGAVSVTAQFQLPPPKRDTNYDVRFHCHYAVPLGNQKNTDEAGVSRITNARAAFNSPFWPFMLNSTSIGQEGLDFHWYCRRIVHWSLPPNPIDLEQREGRINRYKSLVVRQRIAETYAQKFDKESPDDIWCALFATAQTVERRSHLVPFWHVAQGSAKIERIVPAMPYSYELTRLDEVLRIISLYRLSFGQPRQQELVENLLKRNYSEADLIEIRRALLIDLAPINYRKPRKARHDTCRAEPEL
jgi:hypothetical protein